MKRLLICWLLLTSHYGRAQSEFKTWFFGSTVISPWLGPGQPRNATALSFETTGVINSPLHNYGFYVPASSNATLECYAPATIGDAAGNFLFYSVGPLIRDRLSRPMPNGDLRSVDWPVPTRDEEIWVSSVLWGQPAGIVPGPDGLYYVFYWTKAREAGELVYALTYCVVDMRLNGGYGDVRRRDVVVARTRKPRMTLVRHRNNRDCWVLVRGLDAMSFQAVLIGRGGALGEPVVSLAGEATPHDASFLAAAPNGRRLAGGVLPQANGLPAWGMGVYDFDNATGVVSNEQIIRQVSYTTARQNTLQNMGGMTACFSPDSRLLYSSEYNYDRSPLLKRWADVWQYDLGQPTLGGIAQSRYWVSNIPQLPPPDNGFGTASLQLAPDSTVWLNNLYSGEDFVIPVPPGQPPAFRPQASAIIRHPNILGAGCGLEPRGFMHLPGQLSAEYLPTLITNMLYAKPALNYEVGCADDSVQFWASSAGLPAGLRWDFGDPGSGPANAAAGQYVAHRYARAGRYPVRLTLADGRVLAQTVTVAAQAVDFTGADVFTPNNDGLNDAFVPVRGRLPGGRLRVFSRWGAAMFSTADADSLRWDGTGAAAGEYFYQLDYPDCQGRAQHRRGVVTLVR